jgi:glycerol kinase
MKNFILSIDQGTTGSTALLVDITSNKVVGSHNTEFNQSFPKPGLVEHDLNEIWESVKTSIKELFLKTGISKDQIFSIGITNQRETTCAYTKKGTPLAPAIVWQDRRTLPFCQKMKVSYEEKNLYKKTGLPLDPYFSGTKMRWLLDNNSDVKDASNRDDLLLSTIDSYLLYKLTNGSSFKTEASNASRTLLMNLESCDWDEDLLNFFGINSSFLPSITDSFCEFGIVKGLEFLADGTKVHCILGDQQAALFGQSGIEKGDLKCTYGTGAFILLNTGENIQYSSNKLLSTVAYKHEGTPIYALEGATYIAGAAVQWLRDNINLIETSGEVEALARDSEENDIEDLLFMPFFTGIGSPHWNSEAKGAILGLTRGTTNKDLARSCLEGIALSVNDSIKALVSDCDFTVEQINVDGGASLNNLLLELQASFSNMEIIRPEIIETTAYGVAIGALVGSKKIELGSIKSLWKEDIRIKPIKNSYYDKKSALWNKTIEKVFY